MFIRRSLMALSCSFGLMFSPLYGQKNNKATDIGRENAQLAQRAGVWDVKETVWDSPGAVPTTTTWVAERRMVGEFLEEVLEPAVGAPASQIQRIDYLSYHRIEGRWKYVSMDTRASVGMMPASSADRGDIANIRIVFEPFAIPMVGSKAGQLLSMQEVIRQMDANHDEKDQYFNLADGNGNSWLKHKYEYVRRPAN